MLKKIMLAASIAAIPAFAFAQTQAPAGAAAGAATGAVGGAIVGGPVGAAVGAVGGAIVGGIAGATQPEFRTYVMTQKPVVYKWDKPVAVGAVLPTTGVTYYEVPDRFAKTEYRYAVVNDTTVLVDPKSHKIVQIIQ